MLAPMAGIADWAFRQLCYELGAEVTVSPLLPAAGLAVKPQRILPLAGANHPGQLYVVQLYGKNPEDFRKAARVLTDELPIAGIDINMGCPAAQVTNSNHGSALMREPALAAEIVAATCAGTTLPVSVKIRSGWDRETAPELAPQLEAAGAKLITVHGRTKEQQFRGKASLEVIAATKRAVTIPVVGNGDIRSVAEARRMLAETGVDGLMVGRGAMGRPWLFAELRADLKGERAYLDRCPALGEVIRRHARLAFAEEGQQASLTIRKHLINYATGSPIANDLRRAVVGINSLEDVDRWVERLEAAGSRERTAVGQS